MVVRKMKDKCKDAARMRREKERAEFEELSRLLPLPSSTSSQLDKASIIRLTSSYLRMRSAFPEGLGENWGQHNNQPRGRPQEHGQHSIVSSLNKLPPSQPAHNQIRELGSLILQTLEGFVFAMHRDGKIMYISETASVHLGLPQIDLTGSSVFDYVHPSDREDLKQLLGVSKLEEAQLNSPAPVNDGDKTMMTRELGRSFCMRMKCILPKRNAGLVSSGYKAIHCNGYLKVRSKSDGQSGTGMEWESYALVAVGHSLLPTASTEFKLTDNSFMFRAGLDFKFFQVEPIMTDLLGLDQLGAIGQSLYQFVHPNDLQHLEQSHRLLLDKGQVVTRYYRLMKRTGGFIWVQSYAILVSNPRNMPKPQHIISICMILSDDRYDESCFLYDGGATQSTKDDDALGEIVSSTINSGPSRTQLTCQRTGVTLASTVIKPTAATRILGASHSKQTAEKRSHSRSRTRGQLLGKQPKVTKSGGSRGKLPLVGSQAQREIKRAVMVKTRGPATIHHQDQLAEGRQRSSLVCYESPCPSQSYHQLMIGMPPNGHNGSGALPSSPSPDVQSRLNFEPASEAEPFCATANRNSFAASSTGPGAGFSTIGSTRRASDDSCSIVSSVASTGLSSRSSTHHLTPETCYLVGGSNCFPTIDCPHDSHLSQHQQTLGSPTSHTISGGPEIDMHDPLASSGQQIIGASTADLIGWPRADEFTLEYQQLDIQQPQQRQTFGASMNQFVQVIPATSHQVWMSSTATTPAYLYPGPFGTQNTPLNLDLDVSDHHNHHDYQQPPTSDNFYNEPHTYDSYHPKSINFHQVPPTTNIYTA